MSEALVNITEKAALYTNQKGELVFHSSYSSRSDFSFCPEKFRLSRVEGMTEKVKRAATWFGHAIEDAVQWHVEHGYRGGPEKFVEIWDAMAKEDGFAELEYSDTEKDFANLRIVGMEMLMLFAIRVYWWPFPIQTRFQVTLKREIWPNTSLAGIINKARIDAISLVPGNHSALVKIENAPQERYVLTDIKTASKAVPRGIVVLDKQLREYGWQAIIQDVAFLWFEKRGLSLKKGDIVALLETIGTHTAGSNATILYFDKETNLAYAVATQEGWERYGKVVENLSGKALENAKKFFVASDPDAFVAGPKQITKQRVDFVTGRLTEKDFDTIGKTVSQETAEMVHAHKTGFYPQKGGVRYPNEKCNTCYLRGHCANNPELAKALSVRSGEEWLEIENMDVD